MVKIFVLSGQPIDSPVNGPAPPPWSIPANPPQLFKDHTANIEVPHTANIKVWTVFFSLRDNAPFELLNP